MMRRLALLIALLLPWPAALGQAATGPGQRASEPQLWATIEALHARGAPADTPAEQRFAERLARQQELVRQARLYLRLYPGGEHRDTVIAYELGALFDIGTLQDGELTPLRERAEHYLQTRPSRPVVHEAAYWRIVAGRVTDHAEQPPTSQPGQPLRDDYRKYISEYPDSRHTPRLAALLFDDARDNEDLPEMRRLVAVLGEHFADAQTTRTLAGQLARYEAVGQPFPLQFGPGLPDEVDLEAWRDHPLIIVVWSSDSQAARSRLMEIEDHRRRHADLRVLGVNVDPSHEACAAGTEALGITWPQVCDELGRATPFARQWGITNTPQVFVLDREHRLVGFARGSEWEALLERAGLR